MHKCFYVYQLIVPFSRSSQDGEEEEEDDVSTSGDEEDEAGGSEDMKLQLEMKPSVDKVTSAKETEAGAEISALVNYVQPIHFTSFENAESKSSCFL